MNGTEMNMFEANFLYSRKKLKESLKQALESKSYLFPVFGPFSIIMTIIYLPFGIISLPFNLFWFMKLKKLGLEKTYNFVANGEGDFHSQLWFMPTSLKNMSKKNKEENMKEDRAIVGPMLKNFGLAIINLNLLNLCKAYFFVLGFNQVLRVNILLKTNARSLHKILTYSVY